MAALVCVGFAHANVSQYGALYTVSGSQVADAPPAEPVPYFYAYAYFASGDATLGGVTKPDATTLPFVLSAPQLLNVYSFGYSTIGDLATAFPSGDYSFEVDGGAAGFQAGTLAVPAADFMPEYPYLTNYSALQLIPSGIDATLNWDGFAPSLTATRSTTTISVTDFVSTDVVANTAGNADTFLSHTIPGSWMRSGHAYGFALYYDNEYILENAGMGGATATTTFDRNASGLFKVKADPGTLSGQVFLDWSYLNYGTPVTVTIYDENGAVLDSQVVNLGYSNYYAFDTNATGVRSVAFKASHWLTKIVRDVDIDAGQDYLTVTLSNGDCDGDDDVDIDDYDVLAFAYGTFAGDPGYSPDADLDGDGDVDIDDYDALANEYGQFGDQP